MFIIISFVWHIISSIEHTPEGILSQLPNFVTGFVKKAMKLKMIDASLQVHKPSLHFFHFPANLMLKIMSWPYDS